jgi:methionyl aminopeptidase
LDVCIYFDGFHGDTNLTLIYGGLDQAPTTEVRNILSLCQDGLYHAISVCKPGVPFIEIGRTLEQYAIQKKIHVCPYFSGHGIGRWLHMQPYIYHTCTLIGYLVKQALLEGNEKERVMKAGNVFTIEPTMTVYDSSHNLYQWSDSMTVIC